MTTSSEIRDALERHAVALYEACDSSLSPWPEDPDGSTLRFSRAIVAVLDMCDEWDGPGAPAAARQVRRCIADVLEMPRPDNGIALAPYPREFYPGCPCFRCCTTTWYEQRPGVPAARMSLCPQCGNKRCPGAKDHDNMCTGSNAPGQPGSLYARGVELTDDLITQAAAEAEEGYDVGQLRQRQRPRQPDPKPADHDDPQAAPPLWWLSFVDPTKSAPTGQQVRGGGGFLGVAIVEGETAADAITRSHMIGVNPGGEIGFAGPLPAASIPAEWRDRLLTAEEADSIPEPGADDIMKARRSGKFE